MFEAEQKELKVLAGARVIGFCEDGEFYGLRLHLMGRTWQLWFLQDSEGNNAGTYAIEEEGEEDGSKDVVEG